MYKQCKPFSYIKEIFLFRHDFGFTDESYDIHEGKQSYNRWAFMSDEKYPRILIKVGI